jgi:hypothetical protein
MEMHIGDKVWYEHVGKDRYHTDSYMARAIIVRIGKRTTIHNLETGMLQVVKLENLSRVVDDAQFMNGGMGRKPLTEQDLEAVLERKPKVTDPALRYFNNRHED